MKKLTFALLSMLLLLGLSACVFDVSWVDGPNPNDPDQQHDPDKYTEDEKYIIENTKDFAFTWQCEEGCSDVTVAGGFAPYTATFTAKDLGEHAIGFIWNFGEGKERSFGASVTYRFETPGDKLITLEIQPFTNSHPKKAGLPFSAIISLQEPPLPGEIFWTLTKGQDTSVCEVTLTLQDDIEHPGHLILHGKVKSKIDLAQIIVGPVFFTKGVQGESEFFWRLDRINSSDQSRRAGVTTKLGQYRIKRGGGDTIEFMVEEVLCFSSQNANPVSLDFGYPSAIVIQVE